MVVSLVMVSMGHSRHVVAPLHAQSGGEERCHNTTIANHEISYVLRTGNSKQEACQACNGSFTNTKKRKGEAPQDSNKHFARHGRVVIKDALKVVVKGDAYGQGPNNTRLLLGYGFITTGGIVGQGPNNYSGVCFCHKWWLLFVQSKV